MGGGGGYLKWVLGDEKVRKWRWEEVRTRDMAPSYKDPTVQESQHRPLHWQNKSTHRRRRRRKRGAEEEGKRGGGLGGGGVNHTEMAGVGFGVAAVPGQSKQ